MRVMLDTNIIVDIISKRVGYSESLSVLECCEVGYAEGNVSTTTVTDVMYILRKQTAPNTIQDAMQTLLAILDVAGVVKSDITNAFVGEISDFEDAVQAFCAARHNMDYIITRNVKDFKQSSVQAILPDDFLKLLENETA